MWERSTLKERAKSVFKANYWKCVLAALVLMIALGGASGGSSGGSSASSSDLKNDIDELTTEITASSNLAGHADDLHEFKAGMDDIRDDIRDEFEHKPEAAAAIITIVIVVLVVVVVAIIIGVLITTFLLNPLQVGCRKFFLMNLNEKASLKELGAGFEKNYMNIVKAMFMVDLSCFLWGLLFIIPGIIKRYEYRMVCYLVALDPSLSYSQAKEMSSEMMSGQKWNAFVLDLSFLGWHLLSICTCGLLSIFYVNPYMYQTEAALFEALNGGVKTNDRNRIEDSNYEPYVEM